MTKPRYIFLSHNSTDKPELLRFAEALVKRPLAQTHNLQVWLDKTNLEHGVQYTNQFAKYINHADTCAFLLFMPREPIRAYVDYEIGIALDRHLGDKNDGKRFPILPVYPGARSERIELPEAIRTFNYREYVYDDVKQMNAIITDALGNLSPVGASPAGDSSDFIETGKESPARQAPTGEQREGYDVWLSWVLTRKGNELQAEDDGRNLRTLPCAELPGIDATPEQLLPLAAWLLGEQAIDGIKGRVRILTDAPELAMLPWHRLPHPQTGKPLLDSGWVVETGAGRSRLPGFSTLAPHTPLLVIPANQQGIVVDKHCSLVENYLEAYLDIQGLVPRIKTPQSLRRELRLHQPDLLYIYARFEGEQLQLDSGADGEASLSLQTLGEWIADAGIQPVVIINVIGQGKGLEHYPHLLVQESRLVWIQCTFSRKDSNWADLEKNLSEVMERTANNGDLSGLIAQQALHPRQRMQSFVWMNGKTPQLQVAGSQQKRARQFRAALLKVMLGRVALKDQMAGSIQRHSSQHIPLTTYAVTGDAKACPHDVPEQIRQRLQYDDPKNSLTVVQYYFHITIAADEDALDVLEVAISEGILHGSEYPEVIFNRELKRRGLSNQECCIALNWLFRVEEGQEAAVSGWLDTWGASMREHLTQVKLEKAILINAFCLEVHDERHAQSVQASVNKELRNLRTFPACPMVPIILKDALSKLEADEINDFLESNQRYWYNELKLPAHKIDPWAFAEWVAAQTGGLFETTVNLIWKQYQRDYQEYLKP